MYRYKRQELLKIEILEFRNVSVKLIANEKKIPLGKKGGTIIGNFESGQI